MSFKKLINKVELAEDAVEANERRVGADLRQLRDSWVSLWTPGRIVIAGIASGFLLARAEPMRTVARSGGLLRTASTVISWVSGLTAAVVADKAGEAGADDAAAPAPANNRAGADADAEKRRYQANERIAHDYLERMAAAARQAGGNGGS